MLGSVGSQWPLLGSHHLKFGPGRSEDEDYLHTLSSACGDASMSISITEDFVGFDHPSLLNE